MLARLKTSSLLEPSELAVLEQQFGRSQRLDNLPPATIKLLVSAIRNTRSIEDPETRKSELKKIVSEPRYAAQQVFEPVKIQNEVNREASRGKISVAKSSVRCKKCGEYKVMQIQMQVGSADEAMTTFYECSNCGNKWKGSR